MQTMLALIASFLIGSIPTAYIIVKAQKQGDIRRMGSGNVGSMNVRDQLGYKPAILVLLIDAAKGAASVYLAKYLGIDPGLCLAMAVAGHIYPPWLKFQGGKGLATALGGILALWIWPALLVFVILWIPMYLILTRKNGDLANMIGALGISIYSLLSGPQWGIMAMGCVIALKHYQVIHVQAAGDRSAQ